MTGLAWQVSDEDIRAVLSRHGIADAATVACAAELIEAEAARIEQAALFYCNLDLQARSAMDEIEQVLFESGVVSQRTDWQLP